MDLLWGNVTPDITNQAVLLMGGNLVTASTVLPPAFLLSRKYTHLYILQFAKNVHFTEMLQIKYKDL